MAAPERVELGVFGDSYASGAGTDKPSANYATRTVAASGQPARYVDPAHQSTRAPAWQAVDRLRRAHPKVDVHVAFDPVLGTTTGSFRTKVRTGTPFEHPAQLAETAGKDVVLLSIGGDEADLGGWARIAADAQEDTSASAFPGLLARLRDPAFARRLQQTYEAVLANLAPGGTLIVTTYPVILPDPVPAAALTGSAGWVITTREARLSNDYVRTLDAVIGTAVKAVAARAAQQRKHVDIVDLRDALGQHLLFSAQPAVRGLLSLTDGGLVLDSFHPNDLGQQIIGQHLQPALDRAVGRAVAARGSAGRPAGPVPSRGPDRPGVPVGPSRSTPGEGTSATRPPLAQHGHGPAQPVSTSAGPPPSNPNHPAPAGSAPHGASPPPGRSTPAAPNPVGRTPTSNPPSGSTPAGGVPTPAGPTPANGNRPPAAAVPAPPAGAPAASGGSDATPDTATPATDPATESSTDNDPTTESDPDTTPATDDARPTATDPADSPDTESNTDAESSTDSTEDASDSPGSDSADGDSDGSDAGSDGDGGSDGSDGGDGDGGDGGGGDGGDGGGGDGD